MPTFYIAINQDPPNPDKPARVARPSEAKIKEVIRAWPGSTWKLHKLAPPATVQTLCMLAEGGMPDIDEGTELEVDDNGRVRNGDRA